MADFSYYQGDLFTTPDTVLAHGCNALGIMGGGIAKYIKDTYPTVYETYRATYEDSGLHVGQVVPSYMNAYDGDPRIMLNIISQYEPGPNANEETVRVSLENAASYCDKYGYDSFSIPTIGCGIGGMESILLDGILRDIDCNAKIRVFML